MIASPLKISATIITKNEADNIAGCLESLSWADEIVVLDSGSADDTVQISRDYTDKVFIEPWPGQGRQKNRAIELAQGPWIFSIDADERPTPELVVEIKQAVSNGTHKAFAMRRKNFYRDKWIRHCGWWPDWVTRVFKKGEVHFNSNIIHESLQVPYTIGRLSHPLNHYSFDSPEDFLQRACWYAHHKAREKYDQGKRASSWTALSHAGFAFVQTYFLRLGFLDGSAGLLVATSNFVGVFYRYMILRELSHGIEPVD
jgi:glycosyltransferase involved in cell wall biosynthesis